MLNPIDDLHAYRRTRTSWHTLAERVLAPARHAATARIGLRPAPGGIATPEFGEGITLALVGTDLVRRQPGSATREPISTLRVAAEFARVAPNAETGVFTATTPADPDTTLFVDAVAAAAIAGWFEFGQTVLERWRALHVDDTPSEIQLWPEHFDLALDLGPDGGRANYGFSPGDAGHELPYAYVGSWVPTEDPFWNAGSYARLTYEALATEAEPEAVVLEFFTAGYSVATRAA